MNGVILELDRNQNLVKIGTPKEVTNDIKYTDTIMIQPFMNDGFYWIDWQGAE